MFGYTLECSQKDRPGAFKSIPDCSFPAKGDKSVLIFKGKRTRGGMMLATMNTSGHRC